MLPATEKTWTFVGVCASNGKKCTLGFFFLSSDLITGRGIVRISERCMAFLSPVSYMQSRRIDKKGNWDICLICEVWLKTSWTTNKLNLSAKRNINNTLAVLISGYIFWIAAVYTIILRKNKWWMIMSKRSRWTNLNFTSVHEFILGCHISSSRYLLEKIEGFC